MKTKSYLLLILFFLLSAFRPWQQGIAQPDNDLAYYLPPGEVIEIPWSKEQADSPAASFLLLHQERQQPYQKGSFIHIPNWGQHPFQSTVVKTLYLAMPNYGWESYALQPPLTDISAFQWQESSEDKYPDPVSPESRAFMVEDIRARYLAAEEYLQSIKGYRVVLAEGLVAAFLIEQFHAENLPLPDALVVVAPYYPQWQLNQLLPKLLAQLPFPVLDLQPTDALDWSQATAQQRVIQAHKLSHPSYRQRKLPSAPHAYQPDLIVHQVYGWLRHEGF